MPEQRIFSEQEVTEIIRRAVEIADQEATGPYTPGVTQTELERIAAEVGVPVEALQRAIAEAGSEPGKPGLFHLTEEFERVVEGEIEPDQFDLVAEGIKTVGNRFQPSVSQIGRKLTMNAWTGIGQANVDITSRNGRTTLKVKSNSWLQALMTLHPGLMATVITVAAMAEHGQGLLASGIGLGIMALSTAAFGWLSKFGHRKAKEMTDSLRDRIAEVIEEQPATADAQQELKQELRT